MENRISRIIKANWPSEFMHLTGMFSINSTIVHILGTSLPVVKSLFFTAMAFALGKELFDKYIKKTEFSVSDITATLIGGWSVPFLILLVQSIKTEWLNI